MTTAPAPTGGPPGAVRFEHDSPGGQTTPVAVGFKASCDVDQSQDGTDRDARESASAKARSGLPHVSNGCLGSPRGEPVGRPRPGGPSISVDDRHGLRSPQRVMPSTEPVGSTILLVEDNEMLLALLRRALEREGYVVVSAPSGAEMMHLLDTSQPDLIVLDVGLPDMDGRDLLAALKKDPKTLHIPVIVWSGREPGSDRRIALELGAEDYVEKGPPSTLVPKIERVLLRISERELVKARESLPPKN